MAKFSVVPVMVRKFFSVSYCSNKMVIPLLKIDSERQRLKKLTKAKSFPSSLKKAIKLLIESFRSLSGPFR
jgi:hypothetical protein